MRAGIANFVELPYHDNQGEPIIGAMVPDLPVNHKRDERLIALLAMALTDCLLYQPAEPLHKIPLLVGLAEPGRPGGGADLVASSIIRRVQEKIGVQFHPKLSHVITTGHTSGFEALRLAKELFKSEGVASCFVCGVDSYINASSLSWLNQHWRLKTVENSDGVIPGEAGATILVQRDVTTSASSHAQVMGLGFANENASVLTEEPLLGIGLADAARTALSQGGMQMHEIDFRVSDVTGESYGFKEQVLALGRLMRVRREELPLWHGGDSIGDTGAAAGICQLVMSKYAFTKHYAPGSRVLCSSGSVGGDRAVAVMQQVTQT